MKKHFIYTLTLCLLSQLLIAQSVERFEILNVCGAYNIASGRIIINGPNNTSECSAIGAITYSWNGDNFTTSQLGFSTECSKSNNTSCVGGNPTWTFPATITISAPASIAGIYTTDASGNITSYVVPVELTYFKGKATEKGNLLTWQTASEENNEGFYIEKSEDGNPDSYRGWETLDFVQGNGTTLEISDYQYLDEIPLGNITYYRLKQVDFDGQFEYSEIVEITNQQSDNSTINIFPNPIRNVLNIENGEGEAIIYNLLGQPIQSFSIPNSAFLINISDLPRGQYILHIRQQNGEVITTQFIK